MKLDIILASLPFPLDQNGENATIIIHEMVKKAQASQLLLDLYDEDSRKLLDYKTWEPPYNRPKPIEVPIMIQQGTLIGPFSGLTFTLPGVPIRKQLDVHKQCGYITKFKDAIRRYQGRQSCKVPNQIFDDLEHKLSVYKLLVEGVNGFIRYARVTKHHVATFLKELKYAKQYENVNLIYYILTDRRDDISHLESQLIEDFKLLLDMAFKYKVEHLINVKYSLYQLLKRYGHKPDRHDAMTVKAGSRGTLYDDICRKLYLALKWEFSSL